MSYVIRPGRVGVAQRGRDELDVTIVLVGCGGTGEGEQGAGKNDPRFQGAASEMRQASKLDPTPLGIISA